MKVLVIEDDPSLREIICRSLEKERYVTEEAPDFQTALEKTADYTYDCILLDIMLPDGNGLDLLEELKKENKKENIIIISAKDSLEDKVTGLDLGADDYLPKPFHLAELGMRVYAIIRRKEFGASNTLENNGIKINLLEKSVEANGRPVTLTKSEYDLLLFFIGNRNRVLSKGAIAEHLSGDFADMMDNFDFVYTHIKNLKAKLAQTGMPNCIQNVYGMGYKWIEL